MDSRGASEVVGFVLIFSLISLSVGAVYVGGFSGLQSARDAEQLNNAERAFDVLADNMDDIAESDAPNRATEFKLYGSDFYVDGGTRFTVRITNLGDTPTYSVQTHPLVYNMRNSPTSLSYVNGAVVREDRGGAVFLNEPTFVFRTDASGDKTAIVPLIETREAGKSAVGGTGTVLIQSRHVLSEALTTRTGGDYTVEFTVETGETKAQLWEQHLEAELDSAYGSDSYCSRSGGTVTCTFTVQRLYVTATRIDVTVER